MRLRGWMPNILLVTAGLLGIGLGILNGMWFAGGRHAPAYAIPLDVLGVLMGLVFIIWAQAYARRSCDFTVDEFVIAKTHYAGQQAFITGMILNVVVILSFSFMPDLREAVMKAGQVGSLRGAFSLGMSCAIMLFVIGAILGRARAWWKYR